MYLIFITCVLLWNIFINDIKVSAGGNVMKGPKDIFKHRDVKPREASEGVATSSHPPLQIKLSKTNFRLI